MKERPTTFVDTTLTSAANIFGSARKVACSPASELWNRTSETREVAKRQLFAMLRLRVSKVRSPGRLRFA